MHYHPKITLIAMMPLNHMPRKCTERYTLNKSQEKINHPMYMGKLFVKKEKELDTLIHAVKIYCQNTEIWLRKMCHASGKRHLTDGIELPIKKRLERSEKWNPTKIWTLCKLRSSNECRWKNKINNISGEPQSKWRLNYVAENLSNE